MAARRNPASMIYTLRIELRYLEPLIWRRLHVPTNIPVPKLHKALQAIMGWTDSHLHSFRIGDRVYGNGEDLGDMNSMTERLDGVCTVL